MFAGQGSISCAGPHSCAAGGAYAEGAFRRQAFVVNEKNGVWRKALRVPGSAALNLGGGAEVESISCATTGSCAAGGHYTDDAGHYQAFVANKRKGVWRKAIPVPGLAGLNRGGMARVYSISCATATSCAAGGRYLDHAGHRQAFVVNERAGVWRKAIPVPGLAALNVRGDAKVTSISCATARSCAIGGYYGVDAAAGSYKAFVANETNGVWGNAVEIPSPPGASLAPP